MNEDQMSTYEYVNVPLFVDRNQAASSEVKRQSCEQDPKATSSIERISGIPVTTIQTFKALQQRRLAISAKSAQKIAKMSNKRKKRKKTIGLIAKNDVETLKDGGSPVNTANEEKWTEVRRLLDVNSHLCGPVGHGVCQPKSGMEVQVNEAIAEGDAEKAEQLSDQLAAREFSVRVAQAFAAKRYLDEKEEAKKKQLTKAKMKLHWGFEAKQRWEMKGNM